MSDFQINYSKWAEKWINFAQKYDTDGIQGLSKTELIQLVGDIKDENVDTVTIRANLKKVSGTKTSSSIPVELQAAVNYFNINDDDTEDRRSNIVGNTYTKGEAILHALTSDIDNTHENCAAYKNINLIPKKWFRWYRPVEFVNFDLREIQEDAIKNITSLNKLQDDIQKAFETAHGTPEAEHITPKSVDIDMETFAQNYLGMSYEEFAQKYKDELEKIKTITNAELNSANTPQSLKDVHYKAQQYAYALTNREKEIMRDVRTESGNREKQEVFDYGDNMYVVEDMKLYGITPENFEKITNPVMYRAFTGALSDAYQTATDIEVLNTDSSKNIHAKEVKTINGTACFKGKDGHWYTFSGVCIK